MRRIKLIILGLAVTMGVAARPAKPGPTVVVEADGTERVVYLHGDEDCHYMTLPDGRWVAWQDGFLREVKSMSDEEIATHRAEKRAARAPRRVTEETNVAIPLNIAPRGLIILAQFNDLAFREANNLTAFTAMFNSETYAYNGATGSAKRYFEDQSLGAYSPVFDVVGPVTVSQSQRYYGENDRSGSDRRAHELIIEACQIADTAFNVDFSVYDNDHDGFIDFVYVIYAGQGEADGGAAYTIWPHTSWIYSGGLGSYRFDGKRLDTYACSNELQYRMGTGLTRDGIGAFCHEFSHVLGFSDHYATNGATTKLTGTWDIMCSGSYNNNSNTPAGYTAYERFFVGWTTPVILNSPVTIDSMKPLVEDGECYLITETGTSNLIGNDPNPTEFFMLENRYRIGWDSYVPGNGMLITKIQYNASKWTNNTVNNTASAMGYDIIEADGKTPAYGTDGWDGKQGDAFPYGSTTEYAPYEEYPVTDIKRNGDGTMFFKFMGGNDFPLYVVKETAAELYGDDYTEVVGVYDTCGKLVTTDNRLNQLAAGVYVVAVSNGTKQKGVKIVIR